MLKLCPDFAQSCCGAVVWHLIEQISAESARHEAERRMIRAALELMLDARWRKTNPSLEVHEEGDSLWRIRECRYVLLSRVTDDILLPKALWRVAVSHGFVIVSDDQEFVFRRIARSIARTRCPIVSSISSFISIRMTFSSFDLGQPSRWTLLDLLQRYNRLIDGVDGSLGVDLSPLLSLR